MKEFKGHSEALLSLIDARRNKMETPSKHHKISSMTHEEEEEMRHDILKLRDQVQQNSLSQKVTKAKMDSLKKNMEAKMDGMEAKKDAKMDGMDAKMDGIEEKLKDNMEEMETNLLQEMLTNGERVVKKLMRRTKEMLIMISRTLTVD